jgi:pimeloyl-ACP methyl ester carboxylesterase
MNPMAAIVYERRGAGAPLVLIHGIGHHWRAWEPVIDLLAGSYDVIAIDLPGFGRSPVAAAPGLPGLLAAVEELFGTLSLDGPHVAGNSLGGAVALELAAAGKVASATAFSPAGFASAGQLRLALTRLAGHRLGSFSPTPVLRALYRSPRGRAVAFGQLVAHPGRLSPERALADTLALRRGKGFGPTARAGRTYAFSGGPIEVPVTVAWGTEDRILPYSQAAHAAELLPGARHVALEGCGHVPMSDDPERVARLIRETANGSPTHE